MSKQAAKSIIAEIGINISAFPTAEHLCSWARLRPADNVTGENADRSAPSAPTDGWERSPTKAPGRRHAHATPIWRPARRVRKKMAPVAVNRSIPAVGWHLFTGSWDYQDLGGSYFVQRRRPRSPPSGVTTINTWLPGRECLRSGVSGFFI